MRKDMHEFACLVIVLGYNFTRIYKQFCPQGGGGWTALLRTPLM